uniref:I-spanin n=2 Tax=unclassified bacterial viruses TaxID=12333 RepID=A0AAU6VZG4_9VIRU
MLNYICAILLSIVIGVSGFAYYEHQQLLKMAAEVGTYKIAAETNLKAKEDADKSCLVTVESLNGYYKQQVELGSSQKTTGDAILSLPTLTIKEKANAAPTKPQSFADDDRLSPDVMRLLDTAYCYGDKDSCATSTK